MPFLSNFGLLPEYLTSPDFLSQMSFFFGDFSLAFGALMLSIFVGWVWGAKKAGAEISEGSKLFGKIRTIWEFIIRYFIPILVFLILLNLFGIFD